MRALLKLIGERIGLSYADIVAWLESVNSITEIEQRILSGRLPIMGAQDAALRLAADVHEGYVTAGKQASQWLDTKVDALVRFDTANPQVVARAHTNQLDLVQGFQQEQWKVAQQISQRAIQESATLGTNPRRVAQDFRAAIGLTADQEQWVASYRRALETGDYLGATQRELSSGHADRTLRRLARDDSQLTPAQIDDYVDRYRQNALTYRSETIARTEALRNANAGADDAIRQAISRGDVEAKDLVKEWHAGPATLGARDSHQAMNGVRVGVDDLFVLPSGVRMKYPGDPSAPASETANCRCTYSTSFAL